MSGKLRTAILAAAALGLATSCAKEREPRSYVQPNLLAKKDLTGNWYYAPTVVDIGYGSSATFIGETGMDISIIKWDIQENTLYARLAYDRIRGTESNHNSLDGVAYKGEPIGAWSVQHVDIIRDYNATTGEEINVIRESQERPWYEREFLRVNWAENLVSNWSWIWQRIARFDPLSYFQSDPSHPHATKIERDPAGLASYIGVTSKVLMTPEMREYGYDGIPEIPDCYFYGQTTSCTSTEVTVRHSFVRLDPDNEYEIRPYSQVEMDDYGFFTTQRLTYSRDYDVTIGGITWYANRHNLYAESFQKAYTVGEASLYAGARQFTCAGGGEPCRFNDDNTKVYIMGVRATRESEVPSTVQNSPDRMDEYYCRCEAQGPECTEPCFFVMDGSPVFYPTASGSEKVLLRPKDRPLKPLAYYLNENFPAELLATAHKIGDAWSTTFDRAVWLAAGCDPDAFESRICPTRTEFQDPRFKMLTICENPIVKEGDPEVCGPVGREVRLGDLRYNHLNWVDAPQQSSPLGYGPPMGDPLTGETVSAISNIYGAALDSYSVYARDSVRMVTDDNFPWKEYLNADFQTSYVRNSLEGGIYNQPEPNSLNKRGTRPERARPNRAARTWTQDDVRKIFGAMDKSFAAGVPTTGLAKPKTAKEIQTWMKARLGNITRSGALGNGTNPQQGRINALRDSSLEDLMMTPDHLATYAQDLMTAGYDPAHVTGADLPRGSEIRKRVSPLTRLNLKYLRAINNVKFGHFGKKGCVMYSEFLPFEEPSVMGTATDMVCGNCCAESERDGNGNCPLTDSCKANKAEQTARWAADAKCGDRIRDRLREKIFQAVTIHEMGHNMGLRHNFKGSYDAMNYFDRYWEIRKMDGTIHQRAVDPLSPEEERNGLAVWATTSIMDYGAKWDSDFSMMGRWDTAAIMYGYSGFKQVFRGIEPEQEKFWALGTIQNFRSFSWPTPFDFSGLEAINYTRVHYDPDNPVVTPDGIVDTRESNRTWVPNTYITPQKRFGDEIWMTDPEIEARLGGGDPRVMVPYKFCSDEFRNSSLGCNYFDEGADLYEIAENWMKAYDSYYVLNNFGRDRYRFGWDPNSYTGRIYGRYFDGLQNHLQYYVLFLTILYDYGYWSAGQIEQYFTDLDKGWGGYTLAVARSLDMFARVLNQPQAGNYGIRTRMDGTPYYYMELEPDWVDGCVTDFCIPYIDGKMWEDSWDQDFGYQWYLRKIRYGHFYDRPLAIQVLGEATNNFMGRDTQGDVRKYTINFARLYPDTLKALLAGINNQYLEGSEFAAEGNPFAPVFCGLRNPTDRASAIIDMRDASQPWRQPCEVTGGTPQGFVDPGDTFTTQLYATTLGLAYFPMSYSQEFLDAARIYVSGSGEGIDWSNIPAEAEVVEFTDPFSYKTYQAVKYPDVNIGNKTPGAPVAERVWVNPSIGATMLLQAQEIADLYAAAAAAYQANPNPNTQTDLYYAKQNLQNYIINLDMARSTSFLYEHPDFTLDPQ